MEYNLTCYDKKGYPTFKYSKVTDTLYSYKYSMNYKKKEITSISPENSAFFLTYFEEIEGEYSKTICIGKEVLLKQETNSKGIEKIEKVNINKNTFLKSIALKNDDFFLKAENHNGNLSYLFKIKEEEIKNYKEILSHGKRN